MGHRSVVGLALRRPLIGSKIRRRRPGKLVTRERRGKFVYHGIADKRVVRVLEEAEAILAEVGAHIFRCTRYELRPRAPRKPGTRRLSGRARA